MLEQQKDLTGKLATLELEDRGDAEIAPRSC